MCLCLIAGVCGTSVSVYVATRVHSSSARVTYRHVLCAYAVCGRSAVFVLARSNEASPRRRFDGGFRPGR